jgi:pentapeptide MXKDX repeat protein
LALRRSRQLAAWRIQATTTVSSPSTIPIAKKTPPTASVSKTVLPPTPKERCKITATSSIAKRRVSTDRVEPASKEIEQERGKECDASAELGRDAPLSTRDKGRIVVTNQPREGFFVMKFACRTRASIAAATAILILAGAAAASASYAAKASVLAQEDTMGKDTMGKKSKDTMGKDTIGKDAMAKDSKDTMGKDTMAKDSMKKDETNN